MRAWPVPVQVAEEEKIIGGFMTLRQLGYLFLGFCLGGLGAAIPLPLFLRIVVFIVIFLAGAVFAFGSLFDTPLDVYLWRWLRWRKGSRQMFLRGDEY